MSEFAPAEVETIRLIDLRQTRLLEDIDLLNARILALLAEYNPSRAESESEHPNELHVKSTVHESTDSSPGPMESAA